MVFFSCNLCGESLKKNAVEKHSYKCRFLALSCLDCGKEFSGKEYLSHTSCISEGEKYGGPNHVVKEAKGKLKQQQWVENIQQFVNSSPNLNIHMKGILERISTYENIPMKEKKFKNFLSSCLKISPKVGESVWKVFQEAIPRQTQKKDDIKENLNMLNPETKPEFKDLANSNATEDKSNNSKKKKKDKSKKYNPEDMDVNGTSKCPTQEIKEPSEDIESCNGTGSDKKKKKKRKSEGNNELKDVEKTTEGDKPESKELKDVENCNSIGDSKDVKIKKKSKGKDINENAEEKEESSKKRKYKTEIDSHEIVTKKVKHEVSVNNVDKIKDEIPLKAEDNVENKLNGKLDYTGLALTKTPVRNGEATEDLETSLTGVDSSFKWKSAIKKTLEQAPEKGIKVKKLQTKIVAQYLALLLTGDGLSEEEAKEVFSRKIINDKYVINDKYIKLKR